MATASIATPRYRYHEEAPETVSLPVGELVEHLPADLRSRGTAAGVAEGRMVGIPCTDLLSGQTPRIALDRLRELLPDLVQIPGGRDPAEKIALPPGWIALHFRMVTRREELPSENGSEVTQQFQIEKDSKIANHKGLTDVDHDAKADVEAVVIEAGKAPFPPQSTVAAAVATAAGQTEPPNSPEFPATVSEPSETQKRHKGILDSLPMFRRRHAAETPPVETQAVESAGSKVAGRAEKEEEVPSPRPAGDNHPVTTTSSTALTVERLWKLDPKDKLADPSALQALFMTEEKLTLESVISKAGQLPGLNACVLAHGDQVLCTSNATTGVDLRTLSAQAMTMLAQIRETSANMGIGAVPAVTLHAEQGALSFLHNGELCLLVLHADRGFVPGVRERLQQMLGLLSEAKPALPPSLAESDPESRR